MQVSNSCVIKVKLEIYSFGILIWILRPNKPLNLWRWCAKAWIRIDGNLNKSTVFRVYQRFVETNFYKTGPGELD